jgi:hypothetical protein
MVLYVVQMFNPQVHNLFFMNTIKQLFYFKKIKE